MQFDHMKRRAFITLVGGLATLPLKERDRHFEGLAEPWAQ
jgi:hypothetical protein